MFLSHPVHSKERPSSRTSLNDPYKGHAAHSKEKTLSTGHSANESDYEECDIMQIAISELASFYENFNPDNASKGDAISEEKAVSNDILKWLEHQPPEIDNVSKLSFVDRLMIGNNKPTENYDIMPKDLQSKLFLVKFDLVNPSSRLMILHRQMGQDYKDLDATAKREFLRVALSCVQHFGFCDSFLAIPLGGCNENGIIYSTFYAYIVVPDVERYLNVFRSHSNLISRWPSKRWVTPLWIPKSDPTVDPECFCNSVRANLKQFPMRSVHRLREKGVLKKCPTPGHTVDPRAICHDFDFVISTKDSVVGLFSNRFTEKKINALERCQFLDFMTRKMTKYLKHRPSCHCTIEISLAAPMMMKEVGNIIGLMKFQSPLPSMFIKKLNKKKENLEQIEITLSLDDSQDPDNNEGNKHHHSEKLHREKEYWLFVEDQSLDQKLLKVNLLNKSEGEQEQSCTQRLRDALQNIKDFILRFLCSRCCRKYLPLEGDAYKRF